MSTEIALFGGRRLPLQLFFSRVASHQLPLRNNMPFHRCIQLTPLRTRGQVQLAIERENLEVIAMRARRWTRSAVTRFAEVTCSLHAFGRASFRDRIGLGRDVPDYPMRKQTARRIRVIYDQDQAFRARRNLRNLQRWAAVATVTCEF